MDFWFWFSNMDLYVYDFAICDTRMKVKEIKIEKIADSGNFCLFFN